MQALHVFRLRSGKPTELILNTGALGISAHQLYMWVKHTCVAGWYQNGCAGARSGRHVGGKRSCTWGTWKASLRSAVWCGEAGFPSGWRRPHTECSGMASHLRGRHKYRKSNLTYLTWFFLNLFLQFTWKFNLCNPSELALMIDFLTSLLKSIQRLKPT